MKIKSFRDRIKKVKVIYIFFLCILMGTIRGSTNNPPTVKGKIDQANYIIVDFPIVEIRGGCSLTYVNLNNKEMYGDGWAAKNNTIYTFLKTYNSKSEGFNDFKKNYMLYPFIADHTREDEVKRANYVIVKNVDEIVWENRVVNNWGSSNYQYIKVFYDHACLPIKVQFMDPDSNNEWITIAKYTYFSSTPQEYANKFKKYIKEVKAGKFIDPDEE